MTIALGADTDKLLRRLLIGVITFRVNAISDTQSRISIEAPPEVLVLRGELVEEQES